MDQIKCPSCSARLALPAGVEGREVRCPRCGNDFIARREEPPVSRAAARASRWRAGSRVLAHWEAEWMYPGVIESIDGGVAVIHFDDGDETERALDDLAPIEVEAGDRVYARRLQGPKVYYGADVLAADGEALRLRFDDGVEERTTVSYVRFPRR